MTYTYAILEVSIETYNEIKEKLEKVEYNHVFHKQIDGRIVIDMNGIALANYKKVEDDKK